MLTRQDYETLIEATQAWISQDTMSSLMAGSMLVSLCPDDQSKEEARGHFRKEMDQKVRDQKTRSERAVLLQAKLIQLRDSLDADELLQQARER